MPKIHYPDGYVVEVTGAQVLSAAGASTLQLRNLACSGEVLVKVRRPRG